MKTIQEAKRVYLSSLRDYYADLLTVFKVSSVALMNELTNRSYLL